MSRAALVRALIAFAVVATALALTALKPPRLGLDLRGGTQIVLQAKDTPTVTVNREVTDRTLEVLRHRVDALGVSEPTLTRSGDRRIIVELPGVTDPQQALSVIGRTAQLSFHPVLGIAADTDQPVNGQQILPDESGQRLRVGPATLSGNDVSGASAMQDTQYGGGWQVDVNFRNSGGHAWQQLTAAAACHPSGDPQRRVAIVLDGKAISSPQVVDSVRCDVGIPGGSTTITGTFTQAEAENLALLVRAGALPVPVDVVEQRTVGPTLGADAIEASVQAALIGAALTIAFVLAVYRLSGAMAAIALIGYGVISFAVLLALGATLTLPGIAGFVLAVGMAVDANVLVFERTREEYQELGQGRMRQAVRRGFSRAWSAIADSNATTLLAAILLFFFASGPVRGFGVTLTVGVLASMFTTLVLTRVLVDFTVARRAIRNRPGVTGLGDIGAVRRWLLARRPDFMRHRRGLLVASAVAVTIAGAGIAVRGLDLGVEFTGGRLIEYSTAHPIDAEQARPALADAGFERAVVQNTDAGISVRGSGIGEDGKRTIETTLAGIGGGAELVRDELIGPSLGDELRRNALIALGVALAAQLGYLAMRFRWTFGAAAVIAMAHDVAILLGVFAWLGKPLDGVFLAALLTVIGYSVNDSVVVFDRIRELLGRRKRGQSMPALANEACLQTLPRTINTGMGALFILAALTILGGDTLTDFALALLLGIVVGTYSSMFTATPLALAFERRAGSAGIRGRKAAR